MVLVVRTIAVVVVNGADSDNIVVFIWKLTFYCGAPTSFDPKADVVWPEPVCTCLVGQAEG